MTTRLSKLPLASCMFFVSLVPAAALEGPGRALVISNVLQLSADTQRSGQHVTKEFIVPYAGIIRVRWAAKRDNVSAGTAFVNATSAIDQCGGDVTATATFQAQSCDLRVVAGDRVRVSGNTLNDPINMFPLPVVFLHNVRLYWRVVDATGGGATLVD